MEQENEIDILKTLTGEGNWWDIYPHPSWIRPGDELKNSQRYKVKPWRRLGTLVVVAETLH